MYGLSIYNTPPESLVEGEVIQDGNLVNVVKVSDLTPITYEMERQIESASELFHAVDAIITAIDDGELALHSLTQDMGHAPYLHELRRVHFKMKGLPEVLNKTLYQCPHDKACRCTMNEGCFGCETWAETIKKEKLMNPKAKTMTTVDLNDNCYQDKC